MKMKINSKDFRVREGDEVNLRKWPTNAEPVYKSKEQYHEFLAEHVAQLSTRQQLLYASNRYAVLMIFQAMDAAGKDGAISHVMSGINPQGCQVYSFKVPTDTELQHDFLWRTTCVLPERGHIGIFNRSYYEEVLVVRVHQDILKSQKIPPSLVGKKIWDERFEDIRCFERHMARNGTVIRKFFLNLSKEEQKQRFLARLDQPEKNWKFSAADIHERKYWDDYHDAYEDMIRNT
jgi:PPK2 family polyphosphate:nucleotide phosphotransferase